LGGYFKGKFTIFLRKTKGYLFALRENPFSSSGGGKLLCPTGRGGLSIRKVVPSIGCRREKWGGYPLETGEKMGMRGHYRFQRQKRKDL